MKVGFLFCCVVFSVAAKEECGGQAQLTIGTVKDAVIQTEYAVRGPILVRALKIEEELKNGDHKYPFDQIVKCNIGNPQSLGQKPITFTRQVLSLVMNPSLADYPDIFPHDAVARASAYLSEIKSVGAYSESQGVTMVREEVAEFITNRDDGFKSWKENIFLAAGASDGVSALLSVMIRSSDDAILVPLPQYPLYSALISLFGGYFQGYYMAEEPGWDLDMNELEKSLVAARSAGKTVRGLVVINPGNPTGSLLSEETMIQIVKFCARENIVLMADEVYQTNVYRPDVPFISFRSILGKVGILSIDGEVSNNFQLASFHSTSKGVVGECGLRGGYAEYLGFDQLVKDQIYKLASIKLCSNVPGQLAVGLMVNPPKKGDVSYELYVKETTAVFQSLKRRAQSLEKTLNSLPGIRCNPIEGAMYAFPELSLPAKFLEACAEDGKVPDVAFSLELLEATGLVVGKFLFSCVAFKINLKSSPWIRIRAA